MKTYVTKPGSVERKWYVVDAEGQTLGRLASRIAGLKSARQVIKLQIDYTRTI